jgi:hypothetical protein
MQLLKEISATDLPARTNLIENPDQHEHDSASGPFIMLGTNEEGIK